MFTWIKSLTSAILICGLVTFTFAARPLNCLPPDIDPDTVARTDRVMTKGTPRNASIRELLAKLKARCRRGNLVDEKGRPIYFYHLIGCWGNPPDDYQELLANQAARLKLLKKTHTVIEIPCASGTDLRRIS